MIIPFISFKITCPESMFKFLLDASKWPSTCHIREFDMDRNSSTGVRLNKLNNRTPTTPSIEQPTNVQSKNGGASTTEYAIPETDPSLCQKVSRNNLQMDLEVPQVNN